MKKLFLIPVFLLSFFLCGCQATDTEDFTSQLRLNIKHINENDAQKEINISYPVFGGIEDKETITIINTSISNFVNSQYTEFQNALTAEEQDKLSNTEELLNMHGESGDTNSNTDTKKETEAEKFLAENTDNGDENQAKDPITLSMTFKITYNQKNYLCIVQTYDKNLGKNKEFSGQRSFLFSLENATYLSLGELFVFNEEFTTEINSQIKAELDAGAYTTYDDNSGFTGISKNSKFYIDTNNLYIYYDALEISPDKDVIPTFSFRLSDIKKYANEDFKEIFH